ncbi:DedA family protein [Bacillus massiliigorillae]|uniref:DedA family protein n=1 Tax=Bacillus massiliigorillae TaxID=1243664 RepID=UPI0003A81420|nr:DedA family protein [Bacillus massiliigorillae]
MSGLIHSFLLVLMKLGYLGITFALMIEVIPSEIVLSYAGYLVSIGEISFLGAVVAGTIGGVIAQLLIYWIGKYGGRPFLKKFGKYFFIREKQIDLAEKWFQKYGIGVIFTARFIPIVRHAISIPAGISKMPIKKFTLYTTLAIIPWSILFVYLGERLSSNWGQINEFAKPYVQPVIIIALISIIAYIVITLKRRKQESI